MTKIAMIVLNSIWHDPRVRRTSFSAQESGFEVVVLGCRDSEFDKDKLKLLPFKTYIWDSDKEKISDNCDSFFSKLINALKGYRALVKKCIELKPDIIHANDLNALPIAYFAAKKNNSKIVYDSHEIFTENIGIANRKLVKLIYKVIERFLIHRVDQVVMVSNSSANILEEMYQIPRPLVVTNCALKKDSENLQIKNKNKFEILYQGKFYKGRGYEAFVESASLMKDHNSIQFVLRGYGSIESDLIKLADKLKTGNMLRFDSPVHVSKMIYAASSSHVGMILTESININFINTISNKLFEYVNAGLPVIMTNLPEHRLINDQYNIGLIIEEITPLEIEKAVIRLYNDKNLYKVLCENTKKMANNLNWENEVMKLINVYKNLS